MLTYFEAMSDWFAEQKFDLQIQVTHREGPKGLPKRSAVVGFETDSALGSLAVWDTGEVEAEVVIVETMERPIVVSTIISTTGELRELLDCIARAMSTL